MNCCNHNQDTHTNHEHHHDAGSPGMDHGSARSYLNRFWIVTLLLVPLVLAHPAVSDLLGIPAFDLSQWMQFGIATIIFGFSLVFFQHAGHEIKARQYGMMTLVSLAVGSGYLFSVAATFLTSLEATFYLEISTLVWVLLFGHYLEAKSSSAAGDALSEVAKLLPKQAHKLVNGQETDVDITELSAGDTVVVKPGEKVPADGTIMTGSANVDESLISGESTPVQKNADDIVVAGSICLDGSLTIKLDKVGDDSTVGQIQTLIETAGKTKPRSQRLADKAAGILTFVAGFAALLTLLVWTLVIGETFVFAITLAITVLVIACPHALGLAIPTVTTIATSLAVKNGFFIKDLAQIETIKNADYVVFDKTGTLTEGKFGVSEIVGRTATNDEVLQIAASIEQHSAHIIGQSILNHAKGKNVELKEISNFQDKAGRGIQATIDGSDYFAGNQKLIEELDLDYSVENETAGTIVIVASRDEVLGHIVLADTIKESSYKTVSDLHKMGIKVAMLTGDNEQVAGSVAKELGIDTYFANVLPEDKYQHIKQLQDDGSTVLMVGDGVNDAPALTQADASAAIGAGTDVAVEAGDVVLTDSNPADIIRLITLAKKVYRKMVQNLIWALGYNIIAIPAAAGVFATWGFFLRPEIGALVMSLSTVIVVINALMLRRIDLG